MKGQISYKKDLQKTYMIVKECQEELIDSYCGRMIMRGAVKGLLKCQKYRMDGEWEIWYDITSMQELEQIFAVKEIEFEELKNILLQMLFVLEEMEKCLVPDSQICFSVKYIFMDMEKEQLSFLYDYSEKKEKTTLDEFAEYLLEKISHDDKRSVDLAYFFYEQVQKENFSIKELESFWKREHSLKLEKENTEKIEIKTEAEINIETERKIEIAADREPEYLREPVWEEKKKSRFCWESIEGRLLEGGIVCSCMGIFSIFAYWLTGKYFELNTVENSCWIALSGLVFLIGVVLGAVGLKKQKAKEDFKPAKEMETKAEDSVEEEIYRYMTEEEMHNYDEEYDGKTVYVGNALLNRNYCLLEKYKGEEKRHALSGYPFFIGKDKERVNLRVADNSVSRIHARIIEENGGIYIEDLHSTNGTYLNDMLLEPHERVKLKKGDILQFGKREFLLY